MKTRNLKTKALSVLLAIVMLLGMLPMSVFAASGIEYVDAKGVAQTPIETATDITSDTTTWNTGWYYASGTVTIGSRVTVSGTVNLILADGANLTINGGIRVNSSNKLIIWGQSGGTGKLTASGGYMQAGIGGNSSESGGTITINGGTVQAQGDERSAGIGGGDEGSGGTITINGGTVTASAGSNGAGIGGGRFGSGGNITINGGTVMATGSGHGAGIGGGTNNSRGGGSGGTITITGGTVTASGRGSGAGIGGGGSAVYSGASGGNITISGGTVTATGGNEGAGIGGGKKSSSGNFTTGTNGNALVIASSITTTSKQSSWSGIIYASNAQYASGNVYGDPVLDQNVTIPNGYTLNVPAGSTLTIPEGYTFKIGDWGYLNNSGTIINNGTLSTWMINNSSDITNNGTFLVNSTSESYNFTNNGTIANGENGIIKSSNRPLTGTGTVVNGVAFKVTNLNRIERSDFTHNGTDFSISLKGYTLTDGTLMVKVGGVELTAGTGYTCTYATVDEYQEATITIPAANLKGNIEITAEGTANVYDVTLKANNGTINSGNVTKYTYGEGATLPTDVTKENLTFGGWYENSDFSGEPVTQIGTTDTGAKTYYARWTASVSFDAGEGTGTMNSAVVAEGENYALPANGFTTPNGYKFSGWATTASGDIITTDTITITANTTLYAIWEMLPAEAPTVTAGNNLTLIYKGYTDQQVSVSVTEKDGYTYSYQWYDGNDQRIYGATNSIYTVPGDLTVDSYSYYCRVTAERIDNGLTNFADSEKITVTVNKATPGVTAPTANENLVYNGSEQALISAGSATNGTMQYALGTADAVTGAWETDIPKATKAGTYYVWYKVVGDENYNDVEPVCIAVTVAKAKITVKADDKSKTYGDTEPTLTYTVDESTPLVSGESLSGISVNRGSGEDANTYAITASEAEGANPNYDITFVVGTFTIKQREIEIEWTNTEFTYDGTAKKPTATTSDFVANDDAALTVLGEQSYAGVDYIATVTITGTKAYNYKFADDATTTTKFTIKKADQSKPAVQSTDETIRGKQDGSITSVDTTMEYRKDGETDYTAIMGNKVENLAVGTYYVRYAAKANHNASDDTTVVIGAGRKLTVTVVNGDGYTITVDKTEFEHMGGFTITLTVAEGYSKTEQFDVLLNGTGMNWSEWVVNDVAEMMHNTEDTTITVVGVADITPPEVTITLKENKWTSFWNNITFGLFFNETQVVTITATDNGSGMDKIYYYISETELTENEVESLASDKWTEYDADNKPSIDPDKKCVVYTKATDKAQNEKFISSTGLVFDGAAPVISGIENGKDYYGDVTFTTTDTLAGVKEIKVDGKAVTLTEGNYTITADNAEHTVTVTDYAGNTTEWKITVYKQYTVTFIVDGETLTTRIVNHNADAEMPEIPAKTGYDQTAPVWDKDGKAITEDTTITAVYTINKYTVTYEADGEVVGTVTVEHGKDATAPAIPEKDGYTQTAPTWDNDGKNITSDTVINAVYTINEYTITFMDENGVYKTVTVKHGEKVTMPEAPTKDGYTVKWEKVLDTVTEDTTVKAVYTEIPATDKPSSPQTGDNTNLWLWIALLFISGGAVITLTVVDRKRRNTVKH